MLAELAHGRISPSLSEELHDGSDIIRVTFSALTAMTHETRSACFWRASRSPKLLNYPRWTLFCPGVLRHELANSGTTAVSTDNTTLVNKFSGIPT